MRPLSKRSRFQQHLYSQLRPSITDGILDGEYSIPVHGGPDAKASTMLPSAAIRGGITLCDFIVIR